VKDDSDHKFTMMLMITTNFNFNIKTMLSQLSLSTFMSTTKLIHAVSIIIIGMLNDNYGNKEVHSKMQQHPVTFPNKVPADNMKSQT